MLSDDTAVETLIDDPKLEEAVSSLDKESPGTANWEVFAKELGMSEEECVALKPVGRRSPTKMLMEYIVQDFPRLTMETFLSTLIEMERNDVVKALKEFFNRESQTLLVDIYIYRLRTNSPVPILRKGCPDERLLKDGSDVCSSHFT